MWSTPRWHQRKALLNSRAGYGRRLVMGGVRLQIAFGYGRRLSAGGLLLQPASGNRQRLVTGGVWLRTASGHMRRLGFAWVGHHLIEFSQLHHMIEFSQLHCVSFLFHFQGAGAARLPRIPPNLDWDQHSRRAASNKEPQGLLLLPGTSKLSFSATASSAAIRPYERTVGRLRTHLRFAWVRHQVIELSQVHHMIEFSLLHWCGGMREV